MFYFVNTISIKTAIIVIIFLALFGWNNDKFPNHNHINTTISTNEIVSLFPFLPSELHSGAMESRRNLLRSSSALINGTSTVFVFI